MCCQDSKKHKGTSTATHKADGQVQLQRVAADRYDRGDLTGATACWSQKCLAGACRTAILHSHCRLHTLPQLPQLPTHPTIQHTQHTQNAQHALAATPSAITLGTALAFTPHPGSKDSRDSVLSAAARARREASLTTYITLQHASTRLVRHPTQEDSMGRRNLDSSDLDSSDLDSSDLDSSDLDSSDLDSDAPLYAS